MTLVLSTLLIVATIQVQTGLPSREEANSQPQNPRQPKTSLFLFHLNNQEKKVSKFLFRTLLQLQFELAFS